MEFNDEDPRNIHDDLDQLLEGSSDGDEAGGHTAKKGMTSSKKKVAFKEGGSGGKHMNLDLGKVQQTNEDEKETTTKKKKRKNKKKKNKKEGGDPENSDAQISGRVFDPSGMENDLLGDELRNNLQVPSNAPNTGYMSHRPNTKS